MKSITKNFYGLEYVTVRFECEVHPEHGPLVGADQLRMAEMEVANLILKKKYPIRGKELRVLRGACNLPSRKLAEMLGVTHPTIIGWEKKNAGERLSRMAEHSIRSIMRELLKVELDQILRFIEDKPVKVKPISITITRAA